MPAARKPPLLVIVGPTASGKSGLGLEVAAELDGEIVSADAFAVYRGLDIGTDKPDAAARRRVRHHLIDVADPKHRFSAGEFADQAVGAIDGIRSRGKVPIVVGGTNFYVRALLFELFPSPPIDDDVRASLHEAWRDDPAALHRRLAAVDPSAAERIAANDRQRVIRALEVHELTGLPISEHWRRHRATARFDPLLVAPQRPRERLYARIDRRVDRMFASGLMSEVEGLLASGVPSRAHALKAIGYREVVAALSGKHGVAEAVEHTKRSSRKLAKRQLTWLRAQRDGAPVWTPPVEDGGARDVVSLWNQHARERHQR